MENNPWTVNMMLLLFSRLEEERRRREEEERLRWMRETEERRRLVQQHMVNLKRQRALEAERGRMAREDALAAAIVREEKRFASRRFCVACVLLSFWNLVRFFTISVNSAGVHDDRGRRACKRRPRKGTPTRQGCKHTEATPPPARGTLVDLRCSRRFQFQCVRVQSRNSGEIRAVVVAAPTLPTYSYVASSNGTR